jgi:DNA-binding NarL/FixJ family response regulator/multidrug efflux pump subunit AcrA (membrane-fusion protein)
MIRVLLVDNQKSVRETLKSILELAADFDIVGMADNGSRAIELVQQLQPDVVLMDMEMPGLDGAAATKMIAQGELGEKVKVLIVSSHNNSEYVVRSMQAGARGYLLKGASAEEIQQTVRYVYQGNPPITPTDPLAEEILETVESERPTALFSDQPTDLFSDLFSEHSTDLGAGLEADQITDLGELTLPAVQAQPQPKPPLKTPSDFEELQASEMLIDVVPISVSSSSGIRPRWWKKPAIVMALLGLGGGLYLLRQYLRQVLPPVTIAAETAQGSEKSEQLSPLSTLFFTGKIEPAQVVPINATTSGLIQNLKVKVGQQVKVGESLLAIRSVDAEVVRLEASPKPSISSVQQQDLWKKQQILIKQQQLSQQRIGNLQQEINSNKKNITLLRSSIASGARIQQPPNQTALVRQQEEMVQAAKANYKRQQIIYQRKQMNATAQRGAGNEQTEQLLAEVESARVEMEYSRSNYENAQLALQETKAVPTDLPSAAYPSFNVQEQLSQEDNLRKYQEQLRQEQLSYKQLSNNLQSLQKQSNPSPNPQVSTIASVQPTSVDVIANKSGHVVDLIVQDGTKIFASNKLMGIASKLKVATEVQATLPPQLKVGLKSIVQVADGQKFAGEIVSITPLPEQGKQKVEVSFATPQNFLIGQSATVSFPVP